MIQRAHSRAKSGLDASAVGEIVEAASLWALPPEEFTAARDLLARQLRAEGRTAEAVAVKALRKPTRDAWVVNRLVATSPHVVRAVLEVGQRLRAAQVQRRGDELRALASDRDRALDKALGAAKLLAGRLTPAVAEAVRSTLLAAMADPEFAELVSRGRLTSGLSYAGLGAAPLAAVAPTHLGAPEPTRGDAPSAAAPVAVHPAGPDPRTVAAAQAHLREAEEELAAAQLARADAQQQVDDLEAALAEARAGLRETQAEVRAASRSRDAAARELARVASEPS